jgi:hypothetical protein
VPAEGLVDAMTVLGAACRVPVDAQLLQKHQSDDEIVGFLQHFSMALFAKSHVVRLQKLAIKQNNAQ